MNTSSTSKPGCLSSWELTEIAEDLLPADETQVRLAHVSACDVCGQALRQTIRDLEHELSPTERELIGQVLRQPPSRPVRRNSRTRPKWPHLWSIAAAALVIIAAGSWYLASRRDPVPGLLAQASATARPFDWRLPHADYGRTQAQRGSDQPVPAALLEAQAELAKRSAAGESGVELMRLRAWSELLEHKVDAAVQTLEAARRSAPNDLDVAGLLGVAYAARAEGGAADDYARALAQFSRVLAQRPVDPAALYNRGLTYARLGQGQEAGRDWRTLLRVRQGSEGDRLWSSEVRDRIKAIH